MSDLEKAREFFNGDFYATKATGIIIEEVGNHFARCSFEVTRNHQNAYGGVMGGAIFTLADYALAVACNIDENPTVSVSNTIEFLSQARGEQLIATCNADKSGRSLGFYTIDVVDELGTKVAHMTATCYRRG